MSPGKNDNLQKSLHSNRRKKQKKFNIQLIVQLLQIWAKLWIFFQDWQCVSSWISRILKDYCCEKSNIVSQDRMLCSKKHVHRSLKQRLAHRKIRIWKKWCTFSPIHHACRTVWLNSTSITGLGMMFAAVFCNCKYFVV